LITRCSTRWNDLLSSYDRVYGRKAEWVCRAPGRVKYVFSFSFPPRPFILAFPGCRASPAQFELSNFELLLEMLARFLALPAGKASVADPSTARPFLLRHAPSA
jgi:hypothetical protein